MIAYATPPAITLPNPQLTPGKTRVVTLEELCTTSTKLVRHTTSRTKRFICKEYQVENCPGSDWEIDHLIPLELGGADDKSNLWPQPIAEAHEKDKVENKLHKEVCTKEIDIATAQDKITHWWAPDEQQPKTATAPRHLWGLWVLILAVMLVVCLPRIKK